MNLCPLPLLHHDAAGYRVYGGVAIVATPITAQKYRDSSRTGKV